MARTSTKAVAPETVETEVKNVPETKATAKAKEYAAEDLIPCRSITQGELIMIGRRSKIPYRWFGVGEIVEVEYQDLLALNSSRSEYLYGPYFIIEDPELLEQTRWKGLQKVYENLYNDQDMDEILDLAPAQLKQILHKLPTSYKKALAIEVATRIERGVFDSINRIKVCDEVLGTDLMCLVK